MSTTQFLSTDERGGPATKEVSDVVATCPENPISRACTELRELRVQVGTIEVMKELVPNPLLGR